MTDKPAIVFIVLVALFANVESGEITSCGLTQHLGTEEFDV